jgi:hypothetical protein
MKTTKVNDYTNLNLSLKEIAYKILERFFFNYQIWNEKNLFSLKKKSTIF